MRTFDDEIESLREKRYSSKADGKNGLFFIPSVHWIKGSRPYMKVIVSDGGGWDHVSVSLEKRCPTWEEMCHVKDIFFDAEETVIQFHPAHSEYVNNHPFCLHLWRNQEEKHELPPSWMTGVKPNDLKNFLDLGKKKYGSTDEERELESKSRSDAGVSRFS